MSKLTKKEKTQVAHLEVLLCELMEIMTTPRVAWATMKTIALGLELSHPVTGIDDANGLQSLREYLEELEVPFE